jgi:hypothetical protein
MVEEALRPTHATRARRATISGGPRLIRAGLGPGRAGLGLGRAGLGLGRAGLGLGRAGLVGLALLFGWLAPTLNAWPAGALLGALLLDAVSRAVAAQVARRGGIAAALGGLPSLVLGLGSGTGLAVAALSAALALLAWPAAFPVLASALAGLVTIGACARLALARIVNRIGRDPDLTGP